MIYWAKITKIKRTSNTENRFGNFYKQKYCELFWQFFFAYSLVKELEKFVYFACGVLIILGSKALLYLLTIEVPLTSLLTCLLANSTATSALNCVPSLKKKSIYLTIIYFAGQQTDGPLNLFFFSPISKQCGTMCLYLAIAFEIINRIFFGCLTPYRFDRTAIVSCCVVFWKGYASISVLLILKISSLKWKVLQSQQYRLVHKQNADFGAQTFDKKSN